MTLDRMLIRRYCHDALSASERGCAPLAQECIHAILAELKRDARDSVADLRITLDQYGKQTRVEISDGDRMRAPGNFAEAVKALLAQVDNLTKERNASDNRLSFLADWCKKVTGVENNAVIGRNGWPDTIEGVFTRALEGHIRDLQAALTATVQQQRPSVRDGDWTWSVPADDKDTVRGSTEDGWAASVQRVGDKWCVTTTLNTKVGDAVFGNRCNTREHGMLIAQTKRIERLPNAKIT